jgi:uncharacterized membrane protein YgdD (TMEM256/DUF423 family)
MDRIWLVVAAVNGFMAVAAGAFGAHGLKSRVGAEALAVFETAARYHMYHALALLAVGLVAERWRSGAASAAGWCFTAGIVVFCGTLYALALTNMRYRWLGAITPIGGLALLLGWALLAVAALRLPRS